jgi:signal transduction histidine kinase
MLDRFHAARRRLLVVDDNPDIREHVAELLESEGFDVVCAPDGEEALSILRSTPSFDLILLDLLLPKIDGWQFRVIQRADPLLCSIPVVAMSASTSAHAKAIDADAYVPKPFEPDALVGAVRHVLERHRSSQTDRLTSLGRMAAGIAHEVNNPLTYIYASLALADTALVGVRRKGSLTGADSSKVDEAVDSLHRALEGVDRIRAIMNGVRLLIQAPDERRGLIDIRDVIESSLAIVDHEAKQKARVAKILDEVPIVSGNAGQLCQLIVNLVANALDSMTIGDANEHCLTIRTGSSDGEAVIEVEDTGVGMSEDVRGRIFEPFFTTKPPGVGTGLGLSICHGIARNHGGSIEVESDPGRGSCFRVRLPGAHAPEASKPAAVRPGPRRTRLLVVEDDVRVADALGQVLERNYETTVVHAGEAALEFLEKPGNPKPDIILCDMFLGSMTGQDIYERLRRTQAPVADRMIFMTGAAFTDRARRFFDEIPNPCLEKPFQPADFEKAIERLPSRSRGASRTRMRAVDGEGPSRSKGRTRSR